FVGTFNLETVVAVASGSGLSTANVIEGISSLVRKSLVSADLRGPVALYRLLDTTRVYALRKLEEGGEFDACMHRYTQYHRELFRQAAAASRQMPIAEWLG